jgi:hypothetical protein
MLRNAQRGDPGHALDRGDGLDHRAQDAGRRAREELRDGVELSRVVDHRQQDA